LASYYLEYSVDDAWESPGFRYLDERDANAFAASPARPSGRTRHRAPPAFTIRGPVEPPFPTAAAYASAGTVVHCSSNRVLVGDTRRSVSREEDHMAQTKAQRSAAAKKAAATRKRNAAKKSAQDVKGSARSTGRSVTDLAKAAGSTAQSAAKSVAKRADAARRRIG
jgi:hypothetical protein